MERNPFVFGKIVKGVHFLNRDQLRKELKTEINNHTNILLYAPRRFGKTSLVLKVFEDIKKQKKSFSGLMVDFYRINTREKFIQFMADEYAKNSGLSFEKLLSFIKNTLSGVVPAIEMDSFGNPTVSLKFTPGQTQRLLHEVLQLPKKLADSGRLVCVFFDEFQEISELNGNDFQKQLRAEIQHHENVSYIFSGSKYHLFHDIFEDQHSPLYHIGKTINLPVIEEKYYISFIVKQLRNINDKFDKESASTIYNLTNGIPYYVQMLAHEVYNLALLNKNGQPAELISLAQDNILANKNDEFLILYENLNLSSRITLDMIIRNQGQALFSEESLAQYPIAASTVKKALTKLIEKGIINKTNTHYTFQDVFFEKWLHRKI